MRALGVLVALTALSLPSCGGGDGGSCEGRAPCGGTIAAGRYKISSYCASASGPLKSEFCPAGISVDASDLTLTGTVTFNADMTYQSIATIGGTITEFIPAECLSSGGLRLTCEALSQSLKEQPGVTGSCTGSNGCNCTLTYDMESTMASGTYSTSGTQVTLTPSGGAGSTGDYCATPTEVSITVKSLTSMMGMTDVPTSQSTMVLTKE
jgi:hypothetical protein